MLIEKVSRFIFVATVTATVVTTTSYPVESIKIGIIAAIASLI